MTEYRKFRHLVIAGEQEKARLLARVEEMLKGTSSKLLPVSETFGRIAIKAHGHH